MGGDVLSCTSPFSVKVCVCLCMWLAERERERRWHVYIQISAHTYINIPQGFLLRDAQL